MINQKTFNDLGLSAKVLDAINKKGFEEPTAIQVMTIPLMLRDDTNIIAQAQTGTGKTAAFGLPLIELVNTDSKTVQALILAPTRELAIQVSEEINSLKGDKDIRIVPIYGGQSIDQQLRRLKKGVHIVVGTPGRVIDHLNRKTLKIGKIEHLILDEADEMLNMGFIEDMEKIMKHTNPVKRTLLFSATMPRKIKDLAHKYMDGYEFLTVKKEQLTTNLTEQIYFEVKASDKFEALCRIIDIEDDFYGLIFCRTKSNVDSVVTHLKDRGYDAEAIHGDISQAQRERILGTFKKRKVNTLVATDVAARGIDVNNLTHVINYSLPQDPESYVHRIGRTGRAGNEGTAITFITPIEYKQLMFIQRIAKTDIKKSKIPGVKDIIKAKKKKIYDDLTT
ncbi:MAG: DEAD/DEAH box helicase, partial [Thermodesulfobacteriota bacterium]